VDVAQLKGRRVVILPDADDRDLSAPDVETPGETYALTFALRARKAGAAQVTTLTLEGLPHHGDVVEWLEVGHDGAELARLVDEALAMQDDSLKSLAIGAMASAVDDAIAQDMSADYLKYRATSAGLQRVKCDISEGGVERETLIPLTNFTARIVSQVIQDDGAEESRAFEIEAQVCWPAQRALQRFVIPAERFNSMSWPMEQLGAGAIVCPGQGVREHARAAIQWISTCAPGGIPERQEYTHTGWRQIEGAWLYLHTGGALGASGARADVTVRLAGVLTRYALPDPLIVERAKPGALAAAIRSSLSMLEVAPDEVTLPLYAAIWRAASGGTDFSLHLTGASGGGKSELAALAQQHFGAEMDAKHLPGSWASSANALEAQAFSAKDALFVVDDFVASGNLSDSARMHRDADRLLRGQGNGAGRARMRADTSLRPDKPPRGLIVSTGEDTPRGQSLRARMLVLDHASNSLNWERLTACQRDAMAGVYALALAGYILWMAGRYDETREVLRPATVRAARQISAQGRHRRTSDATAQLAAALDLFTKYAIDARAMTPAEARNLLERADRALERVAAQQADGQAQSDPVTRFLTLLGSVIASGAAHVASLDGSDPASAGRWGWRSRQLGDDGGDWQPQGRRVGWLDGENLYLESDAAFAAAQALGVPSGEPLTITSGALWKRLRDRGLLKSSSPSSETLKTRVTCEGARRWVIHLHADALTNHGSSHELPPPLYHAQNPANPANASLALDEGEDGAARTEAEGWVSGLGVAVKGWDSENDPASTYAETMGAGADMAGLAGFSGDKRASDASSALQLPVGLAGYGHNIQPVGGKPSHEIQPHPACTHPRRARHRLKNGVIACGMCGAPLQLQSRPAMSQVGGV
jgi:hypothetical protein